jgi:nitronate monooxygenase
LTATVSNFGGLGSFGAHGLSPSAIKDVITQIRVLTPRPFAINLWVSMQDKGAGTSGSEALARSLATLAGHIQAVGGTLPAYRPYVPIKFEDQVRVLFDAKVPVFSFIYGIPPTEILDECRAEGILTIGTATTPDEAIVLEQTGVDVIAASGFEAGGHRGSFQRPSEESLTGTFSLVLQVADAVSVPWLPPEASPMLAESSQLLLWEPRAYKSARGSFTTAVSPTMLLPFLPIFVEELGIKRQASIFQWSGLVP